MVRSSPSCHRSPERTDRVLVAAFDHPGGFSLFVQDGWSAGSPHRVINQTPPTSAVLPVQLFASALPGRRDLGSPAPQWHPPTGHRQTIGMPHEQSKAAYEQLRAAHLNAVRASLEDHVARLEWPRRRIERYQSERLRSLLTYARERSPFHAARMADIDPATATVDDLVRLPPMVKQEAQDQWDAIVTAPDITRAGAERVLAEQPWFSYTPAGYQVFSSGGSSGVRGVYVWDWEQFITLACLAWRWRRGRSARPEPTAVRRDWPCLRPESRHTPARHCSTSQRSRRPRPS
jgi:hypothetical protein